MTGANFIMPVICLFCGTLFLGVLFFKITGKSHLAHYLAGALMGFSFGLMVAMLAVPLAENVLNRWYFQGSFSQFRGSFSQFQGNFYQFRQVLYSVRLCLWLGGGAVTGTLMGILIVQRVRRNRKPSE